MDETGFQVRGGWNGICCFSEIAILYPSTADGVFHESPLEPACTKISSTEIGDLSRL